MKTPTLQIIATSFVTIDVAGLDGEQPTKIVGIPPFKSVFSALYELFGNHPEQYPEDSMITIACGRLRYEWSHDYARRCFEEGAMTEFDFANRILVVPATGKEVQS